MNRYGATSHFPKYLNGCKNSERILWKKESPSIETHTRVLLMNPFWSCSRGLKLQGPRAEDVLVKSYLVQKIFGGLITADHKVLGEGCESRNNHRYAVVAQDLATQWIQSFPCKTNASQETERSLLKFLEPTRKPKITSTDNSWEFGKACEDLSWNHCTSTPHRSETNGIAERAVRRIKERTSAVLLQSGPDENLWEDSIGCYCYLRNIQDRFYHRKTPFERRLKNHLKERSFKLVHWLSKIILYPRKTSHESINLVSKYCLEYTSVMYCTREESGIGSYWFWTLRSWKRWTHQESMPKDSTRKR